MPVTGSALSRRALLAAPATALFAAPKVRQIAGIGFEEVSHGRTRRRYLHIHGNETTARAVLLEHLKVKKGKALLVVSDKRAVRVANCDIDPNRMFSRIGAKASLERYNKTQTQTEMEKALALLDRDREAFVKHLVPPKGGLLVALHNNSEGYSVNDELAISDKVALNDKDNPRDFMLATNPADFAKIAQSPFNVVLQATVRTQDGSFSVLAASRGIRYVNIEAALGNFDKQKKMLDFLETLPE